MRHTEKPQHTYQGLIVTNNKMSFTLSTVTRPQEMLGGGFRFFHLDWHISFVDATGVDVSPHDGSFSTCVGVYGL